MLRALELGNITIFGSTYQRAYNREKWMSLLAMFVLLLVLLIISLGTVGTIYSLINVKKISL